MIHISLILWRMAVMVDCGLYGTLRAPERCPERSLDFRQILGLVMVLFFEARASLRLAPLVDSASVLVDLQKRIFSRHRLEDICQRLQRTF